MSATHPRGAQAPHRHDSSPAFSATHASTACDDALPMRRIATGRLSRACRRMLGWVAPRRVATRYARLLGACKTPTAFLPGSCIPGCGARRSWLRLEDRTLALSVWGDPDSQPFVLLAISAHATDTALLAPWVHALTTAGYAVVSFDRVPRPDERQCPSTQPELARDLAAIGSRFGRAGAVVGHSIGASAAVLALADGLLAKRMILLSAQADPREAINRFARRIGVDKPVARHLAGLLERRMGVPLDELQAHRIAPAIATPALVVHDLLDDEVPWAEGESFARHLTNSRLLTTLDLGHHGVLADPCVLRDCMRFLAGEIVGDKVVSSPNLPYGLA